MVTFGLPGHPGGNPGIDVALFGRFTAAYGVALVSGPFRLVGCTAMASYAVDSRRLSVLTRLTAAGGPPPSAQQEGS